MRKNFSLMLFTIILFVTMAHSALPKELSISAELLPEELRSTVLMPSFITKELKIAGHVGSVTGFVIVAHKGLQEAYIAGPQDTIYENDTIFTLKKSRCRFSTIDDNVITVGNNSRIAVDKVFLDDKNRKKDSVFSLLRGKAMFYALKLFKYRKANMTVNTLTAVTGIRGTKFGVEVHQADRPMSSTHLRQSDNTVTIVYGFDGTVMVTSKADRTSTVIGPGMMVETTREGMGNAQPTPPELAQQFQQDTKAPPPPRKKSDDVKSDVEEDNENSGVSEVADESNDEDGDSEASDNGTSDSTAPFSSSEDEGETSPSDAIIDISGIMESTTDVTQTQTSSQTEEIYTPTPYSYGLINGCLVEKDGDTNGGYYYTSSLKNLDSTGTLDGEDFGTPVGTMMFDQDTITYLKHNGMEIDSGLPVQMEKQLLGQNEYMEWGVWKQTEFMSVTSQSWEFQVTEGFFVKGSVTSDRQMEALASSNVAATYSGSAVGTHQAALGNKMTGPFSATVNFTTGSVTDFNLSVAGGSHSAQIANAQGEFTGDSSHFTINTGTGTWKVDGITATGKQASGAVFGPQGEEIGGIWTIKESAASTNVAVGAFQGSR